MNAAVSPASLLTIDAAGVAALCALTTLAGLGAWRPIVAARQNARDTVAEYELLHAKTIELTTQKRALEGQLDAARAQLNRQRWRPQPADRLNQRLAALTDLASTAGLNLEQLSPGPQNPQSRFSAILLTMSARGDFAATNSFLTLLHDQCPDIAVLGMKIFSAPPQTDSQCQLSFDLVWYAAPPAQPKPAR